MNKIWKRLCMLFLLVIFLLSCKDTNAATTLFSGNCGTNLEWSIDSNGRLLISGRGDMIDYSNDNFAPWYSYRDQIKEIKILSEVTSLGFGCFYNCQYVTSVDLGNVRKIGDYAFKDCTKIGYIAIPGSVKEIGEYAFYGCTSLSVINVPSGVTKLGKGAFASCTNMVSATVQASVSELSGYTFNNCSGLSTVVLPASLRRIGEAEFDSCTRLSSVYLPERILSIGVSAFANCTNLKQISIPDSVTEIGDSAFGFCSSLTAITLPSDMHILGQTVFAYCTGLRNVYLPENLTAIGMGAFWGCESMKEIEIPARVITIGSMAFSSCTSMEKLTVLGKNISIGEAAFYGCNNLKTIYGYSNTSAQNIAEEQKCEFEAFDQYYAYQIEFSPGSFVYDGTNKRPTATLKFDGQLLSEGEDYVVSYLNDINAGTATLMLTGKGRYEVTLRQNYQIEKKSISDGKLNVSIDSFVYDGKTKEPAVILTCQGKTLCANKDYSISYENNVNAGTAKVIVAGKNNYQGSITKNFQIEKAMPVITAPSIIKMRNSRPFQLKVYTNGGGQMTFSSSNKKVAAISGNGRITVKGYGKAYIQIKTQETSNYKKGVKKVSIEVVPKTVVITKAVTKKRIWTIHWKVDKTVTGYHIYFSENKDFKGNKKSDTLEKYLPRKKAGRISISSLEKGKTYYLKIRAYKQIAKKKYYGTWSKIKRVKIK